MARRKSTVAANAAAAIRAEMPKTDEELHSFVVTRTNIMGLDGVKCRPGETIMLTRSLAESYHKLGYISVPISEFFGVKDAGEGKTENTES